MCTRSGVIIEPQHSTPHPMLDNIGMRNLRLLLTTYCLCRKQSILPQLMEQKLTENVRTLHLGRNEHLTYKALQQACSSACRKVVSSIEWRQLSISMFQSIMCCTYFATMGLQWRTLIGCVKIVECKLIYFQIWRPISFLSLADI